MDNNLAKQFLDIAVPTPRKFERKFGKYIDPEGLPNTV